MKKKIDLNLKAIPTGEWDNLQVDLLRSMDGYSDKQPNL
jgi:hypothetical protein